jgi:IS30 family transposase
MLGRSPSTLSRELRRNGPDAYAAPAAGCAYRRRPQSSRRPCKIVPGNELYGFVRNHLLYGQWSPEQIAAKLRVMHPDDPQQRVSHETIYAAIYARPKGALREGMAAALRQAKP